MNKKYVIASTFIIGTAFGALASEMAINGLYIFKAGDPIVASEVNSNFELLNKRITTLEKTQVITEKWWDCTGDEGGYASFVLDAGGSIYYNESLTPTQDSTAWTYSYENATFTLNSTQEYTASITSIDASSIRVVPEDISLESFTCNRQP